MKQHFNKKIVSAILLGSLLMLFVASNIRYTLPAIHEKIEGMNFSFTNLKKNIKEIEQLLEERVIGKSIWIESFGMLQKYMQKDVYGNFEVVRDEQGKLHYTYFEERPGNTIELEKRMIRFKKLLAEQDTKLFYLLTPGKYIKGYTTFPKGIPYAYENERATSFLNALEQDGISTIDLREGILESGIPKEKLFFDTDHHWQIETAFWGFGKFVEKLNKLENLALDEKDFYTDIENYHKIGYKDSFIGSMAKQTGKYYGGIDDFTLLYPRFPTDYTFAFGNKEITTQTRGNFKEVLLNTGVLQEKEGGYSLEEIRGESLYEKRYETYLWGNKPFVQIKNHKNKEGPKVLFIKDSMAVPLIAFLSTLCSEITMIDPRYYEGDIDEAVKEMDLDYVFVSFYPPTIVEEFFPFGKE